MSLKEVLFNLYCDKCKHELVNIDEDPCHSCLNEPANEDSHKPVFFEEKDSK